MGDGGDRGESASGFAVLSAKNSLVFGRTASCQDCGSSGSSTKVTSMPSLARVNSNRVRVPPYRRGEETMWSPALARLRTVAVIAAIPEANATAQLPPSKDAIRSSRAVMVGLLRRV